MRRITSTVFRSLSQYILLTVLELRIQHSEVSRIVFLDIIHPPVLFKTHNVSETGICLRLRVEPTQLGSIDRDSPCLQRIYSPKRCSK
jgi:hypothetical protein